MSESSLPPNRALEEFLQCAIFAVAGVSSNAEKFGAIAFRDLRAAGKTVYGINPRLNELDGQKIYPDIDALPETPDVLLLVVHPKIGLGLVEAAARRGVRRVWMQPGAENPELLERCAQLGLQTVYQQCVMRQLAKR